MNAPRICEESANECAFGCGEHPCIALHGIWWSQNAPGHTDLMVAPESIPADAGPPPDHVFVAVFTRDRAHMASVQEVFPSGARDTVALIGADDPDEANDRAEFIADALNRRNVSCRWRESHEGNWLPACTRNAEATSLESRCPWCDRAVAPAA